MTKQLETVKAVCPRCHSGYAIRRGPRKNKQRLQCKNCGKWYSEDVKVNAIRTPKVLVFDIETLPIHLRAWDLYPHYYSPDNIIKDFCILSWSAKWLFDDKVFEAVLTPKEALARNDERIVLEMWKLLNEADIVIGHNAKKFDVRKLNARFLYYRMSPPSPYQVIDTWVAAKKNLYLTSNKLDWITRYIDVGTKEHTDFQLWIDCDEGNQEALKTMIHYNKNDVLILEEMYVILRPWIPQHPNMNVYTTTDEAGCPTCGSLDILPSGVYATPANLYRAFTCPICGTVGRSSNTALTTTKRKNMVKLTA